MSAIARRLVCRLADFGLARLLPVCDEAAFGGTNPYGSPEQFMTPLQKVSLGRKSLTELSLRFMFHNVMLVCLDLRMKCLKARVCVCVCVCVSLCVCHSG